MIAYCAECGTELNRPPSGFKRAGMKAFCCQAHHYSYYRNNPTYRMKNRKYTIEQQEYVRTHYLGTCDSARQISQDLDIPFRHIFYLVKKVGVGNRLKKVKPWTKYEEEELTNEITRLSIITIAGKHKRSPIAIKSRLQHLGILRKGRDGWYNGQDICEIFGVTSGWLTRRIRDGFIKAEQRGGQLCITKEDLITYIRENPHSIDRRKIDIFYFIDLLVGVDVKVSINEPVRKPIVYVKRKPTTYGLFISEQIKQGKCKTISEAAKLWKSRKGQVVLA